MSDCARSRTVIGDSATDGHKIMQTNALHYCKLRLLNHHLAMIIFPPLHAYI